MKTIGMYIIAIASLIETLIALAWAKGNIGEPTGLDRTEPKVA